MVALNQDYPLEETEAGPKNRTRDFFPHRSSCARQIQPLPRIDTRENYDACRRTAPGHRKFANGALSGAMTFVLNDLKHKQQDPYETGEWVDEMGAKWGKERTLAALKQIESEMSKRLDAHEKVFYKIAPGETTMSEMKEMVNRIHKMYSGSKSRAFVNPRTGKATIPPYRPSDEFASDMTSFLYHHTAVVHEPIHSRDVFIFNKVNRGFQGAMIGDGWFGAYTEIGAYRRNVETLNIAIKRVKNF